MTAGYMRRIADIVLGMVVSAVGIVMMLQANIGLEPWSVLQEGMSNTLGITYGTASMIYTLSLHDALPIWCPCCAGNPSGWVQS